MDRIFVVWNEIRTPNNIIIPISSGATDELGGTEYKDMLTTIGYKDLVSYFA